jgi:pyruvate formate lyase activating enzyme
MGIVSDIKRFTVHDGPGIRTTVFLKGCPLSCMWCHNPESLSAGFSNMTKSIQVGTQTFIENEIIGKEMSANEVVAELKKEKLFMEQSGGGVTFSGGEPLFQADFLYELLIAAKTEHMHTAIDTSGYASWGTLEKISQFTDLFLFDIKIIDNELHKKYTAVSNKIVLENLEKLNRLEKEIWVRIPIIPGVNFDVLHMEQTIKYLSGMVKPIAKVNLLPFHNIAAHKYHKLGLEYSFKEQHSLDKSQLYTIKTLFETRGFNVSIGG